MGVYMIYHGNSPSEVCTVFDLPSSIFTSNGCNLHHQKATIEEDTMKVSEVAII